MDSFYQNVVLKELSKRNLSAEQLFLYMSSKVNLTPKQAETVIAQINPQEQVRASDFAHVTSMSSVFKKLDQDAVSVHSVASSHQTQLTAAESKRMHRNQEYERRFRAYLPTETFHLLQGLLAASGALFNRPDGAPSPTDNSRYKKLMTDVTSSLLLGQLSKSKFESFLNAHSEKDSSVKAMRNWMKKSPEEQKSVSTPSPYAGFEVPKGSDENYVDKVKAYRNKLVIYYNAGLKGWYLMKFPKDHQYIQFLKTKIDEISPEYKRIRSQTQHTGMKQRPS